MVERTFRQYALGFGSVPVTATVTLDGVTIYDGPLETVDQPMPPLPNPEYKIDNVAWTWQADADFSGTKELSITVQGTTLLLAQTLANNPYRANVPPEPEYLPFWSIEVDGVTYADPLTDEKINGVVQSGPYRPNEIGQWWWPIPPGSVFTAVMHVNSAQKPYIIFDSVPENVTAGESASFLVSIPQINPEYPLPNTMPWRVVNGTSTGADFVSTSGTVTFDTVNSMFQIDTVAPVMPQGNKDFRVEILSTTGNVIVSSPMVTIVS